MKNKICLLILLVLVSFCVLNAQNNQNLNFKDTIGDYEVEDEFDDDFTSLTYSFQEFEKIVDAIHYQNYQKQMCISLDGQYMATFMQGMDDSFMILAISNQGFKEEIKNTKYKCIKHKGQALYYREMWNESLGKYDDHILLKEQPQHDLVISVMGPIALSKESLWIISNQLEF